MPELNQNVGLVGRDGVVELIELLVDRDSGRPLPVVVAYGPGGGGKTALITHLERRYNANTPLAMVELTQDASKTPQDVLDAVYFRLRRDSHPQMGKLNFPRYEAARIIRACAAETVDSGDAHTRIRRRLSEQLKVSRVAEVAHAGTEANGGVAGVVSKLTQPLTRWMMRAAVVAPQWMRWLLAGPKYAAAFRWYEKYAHYYLPGLARGVHVDNVGEHIHGLMNDSPRSASARDQLNAFMVAALLADIRSEYRFQWARRTNCLVLLDNADLLAPDEAELWAVSGGRQKSPRGKDLLDLIATELKRYPATPLLVVATKQAAPAADGFTRTDYRLEDGRFSDPRAQAQERYKRWKSRVDSDTGRTATCLPLRLDPLTLDETRQLLRELSELDEQTMRTEVRVREIFVASRGHPLAIQLLSKRLSRRSEKNFNEPAVRPIFDELARPDVEDADRDETLRGYVLMRFLQRFRTEPLPVDLSSTVDGMDAGRAVRWETTELLARLAAPMRLDEQAVNVLASDRDPESLHRVKDYLNILSFVDTGEDGSWEIHPLLRDLLIHELLTRSEDAPFSYGDVHRRLAEDYDTRWQPDPLAMSYHLLALGEVEEVAKHFADRAKRAGASDTWREELERVCRAPDVVRPVNRAPWSAALTRLRRGDPRSQQFEQLIEALRCLWSCTSDRSWDSSMDGLDVAFAQADKLTSIEIGTWRSRYRQVADRVSTDVPRLRPTVAAGERYPYPRVWWPRNGIRRLAGAGVVLALAAYCVTYVAHTYIHCDREGLLSPGAVTWLWDDSETLNNEGGQCIGLSDSGGTFFGRPLRGSDETQGASETEIAGLTGLIHQQNAEVERKHASEGTAYVTVVVPTILSTTEPEPKNGLLVGVNELRGAYMAQQVWNSPQLPHPFLLRLVPANAGGDYASAKEVATKIRAKAKQDDTVIGVTGLAQTRQSVVDAAAVLGDTTQGREWAVPMVSSQASGNRLAELRYFFQIVLPNRLQAKAGVDFLAGRPDIAKTKPYVLYDSGDRYSMELAGDYFQATGDRLKTKRVPPPVMLDAHRDPATMTDFAQRMCTESHQTGRKPLVIYTGRANEVAPMLDSLGNTECVQDVTILGSDDIAHLDTSSSPSSYLQRSGLSDDQFFFTGYGIPRTEDLDKSGESYQVKNRARQFLEGYRKLQSEATEGQPFWTNPNSHILNAYDAVTLLLEAASRAEAAHPGNHDRESVYHALLGTAGTDAYHGVSGTVDYGGVPRAGDSYAGASPTSRIVPVYRITGIGGGIGGKPEIQFEQAEPIAP